MGLHPNIFLGKLIDCNKFFHGLGRCRSADMLLYGLNISSDRNLYYYIKILIWASRATTTLSFMLTLWTRPTRAGWFSCLSATVLMDHSVRIASYYAFPARDLARAATTRPRASTRTYDHCFKNLGLTIRLHLP